MLPQPAAMTPSVLSRARNGASVLSTGETARRSGTSLHLDGTQDARIWDYVEDDWAPSSSRPLLVLGADDETYQRGSTMVHVKWDEEVTTRTPDDVRLLTDVRADTPLTTLAPAIGSFSFKAVPGLRVWAESDEGDDNMTWGQYCFHRISYDKCGRDVIEFERKLGNDLVRCAGEKWETLAQDRRWT